MFDCDVNQSNDIYILLMLVFLFLFIFLHIEIWIHVLKIKLIVNKLHISTKLIVLTCVLG